jgi:phosphoribosylformylglycinamidine synthase
MIERTEMRYTATVYVRLKPGYSDPEGETTARALRGLGYEVDDVRASKAYEVILEAQTKEEAETLIEDMCKRLLTNSTKDDYSFEIRE